MTKSEPVAGRHVEQRTVSRKTPSDGKLEITKVAAHALESLGSAFIIQVGQQAGHATLGTMPCTCRGDEQPHVHYFVESELLRALVPGSAVDLVLDQPGSRLLIVAT